MLLTLVSGAFSGCSKPDDRTTLEKFISFLQNAEYPRIYQLLTQKARAGISLVDLSTKYSDIYSKIGLQKAACSLTDVKAANGENETAHMKVTFTCDKLGAFSTDMQAQLCLENGGWFIDWTPDLILPGLGQKGSVQVITQPAKRGEIFDETGEALVRNGYALSVYVDTSKVQNYDATIRLLAPLIGMTENDIRKKLAAPMRNAPGSNQTDSETVPPQAAGLSQTGNPSATPAPASPSTRPSSSPQASAQASAAPAAISYVIKAYPPDSLTYEQQQDLQKIPGVGVDTQWMTPIRTYPYGDMMAQTLGYTGVMSAEDIARPENAGLPQDALVGKTGLESAFEQQLRGSDGFKLIVSDGAGNSTTLVQKAASDGKDLRLTIDIRLQQTAEMLLRQDLSPEMAGSIVVMDPKTGYVEAMASDPEYDPNMFSFPVSPDVMKTMTDKASMYPFMNRATSGQYPPGSTMKPFTAFMALSDRKITPSTVFPFEVTDNYYWQPSEWSGTPIKRKDVTKGAMNLQNCITYSDNIYFAWVAMQVGAQSFYQHCLDLGIGLGKEGRMKFDLPLAASRISNADAIEDVKQLADSGYGQGELLITPLQMATLFGSLGNGGDIMQPRIVASITHDEGPHCVADVTNPSQVWKQGVIPESILNVLLPDLKRVAEIGTAKALNQYKDLKDYGICAKTGTAEIGNDKTREIAWLIGFTTKKMDRLVCVTIEVPTGEGTEIRTDIARQMFAAEASSTSEDDDKANQAAEQNAKNNKSNR